MIQRQATAFRPGKKNMSDSLSLLANDESRRAEEADRNKTYIESFGAVTWGRETKRFFDFRSRKNWRIVQ